jgi:hypothetical protein
VALGSNLNALTLGTYLTGTSYNGSTAVTAAVDATTTNTAGKVVARDGSGNFSAGTITAALSGNATTATSATTAGSANALSGINSNISAAVQTGTISSVIAQDTNTSLYRYTAQAVATFISGQTMNISGTATNVSGGTVSATTGSFSGTITMTGNATSFRQNSTASWSGDPGGGQGKLEYHSNRWYIVSGSDSTLVVQFRRSGSDIGNIDNSGNLTMSGNVTAYSDERLKKDWSPLPADFIERLAKVKAGTYTRINGGERQAGSSAQDWQKLLPEVVVKGIDEEETLSLAYGNAALVAAVKLAERVVALEARLAALEAKG